MPPFVMDLRKAVHPAMGGEFDLRKPENKVGSMAAHPVEHPMERHSPAKTKLKAKGQKKVAKVMHEYKEGSLRSSSGAKVTSRQQALAIGMSEGRKAQRKRRR